VTDSDVTYEQRGDRILVRRESTGEAIGILPVTRLRFTVPKTYYEYANYEVTWVDADPTPPSSPPMPERPDTLSS
jgi:hypothetical protein